MTCIAGLVAGGKVYIGGDSAGMDDRYSLRVRADKKVFRNGDFVMGFTTSFRMGDLLRHAFDPPRRHPNDDVHKFMVTDFVDAVRACLKKGGFASISEGVESGGSFLVGYAGRLFHVESDYQVGESVDDLAACGCGDMIALGSLFSTAGKPPVKRIETALEAAERFSGGVRGPFHVEAA